MSALDLALAFTLQYEGGYDNDPNDRGGETFRGISRVSWPGWEGWELIDSAKAKDPTGFAQALVDDMDLLAMVKQFYLVNFWDTTNAEALPPRYGVALFDFAVHSGARQAKLTLQRALGASEDGVVGPQTVGRCVDLGTLGVVRYLGLRASLLAKIMVSNPAQVVWADNWMLRVAKLESFIFTAVQ